MPRLLRLWFATLAVLCVGVAPAFALPKDPNRVYRVGMLTYATGGGFDRFKLEMTKLGYKEGVNVIYKAEEGQRDMAATVAKARAIVAWKPDVIISFMSNSGVALMEATRESQTPVVAWGSDLKGDGFIKSYRSSGTNFTGAGFEPYMQLIQLRFLKLSVPDMKCVGFFHNNTYAPADIELTRAREAAKLLEIDLRVYEVLAYDKFDENLAKLKADGCKGFILGPHEKLSQPQYFKKIGDFLQANRIAGVGQTDSVVQLGGVASFPPPSRFSTIILPNYADRVLNGEKPSDIQTAHSFKNRFIYNPKAAAAIGLRPPTSLLEEVDEFYDK